MCTCSPYSSVPHHWSPHAGSASRRETPLVTATPDRRAIAADSGNGSDRQGHRAWLTGAARVGYAACGIIYSAIGTIAVAVALDLAERPGGFRRVMLLFQRQPMGEFLLAALGVGLLGYAALNFSGAIRDPEKRGRSFVGMLVRGTDALTAALYLVLAAAAVRLAAAPSGEGGRLIEEWAARMLDVAGGAVILGGIGLTLIGAGGILVHRARAEPFENALDRRALTAVTWRVLTSAARFGTLVRGVVLSISGMLVVEAAVTRRVERVGGMGDALAAVETTIMGAWLLGVAGLGFIAYGAYQLAKIRYRRVPIH